jgi:hypothetical protein
VIRPELAGWAAIRVVARIRSGWARKVEEPALATDFSAGGLPLLGVLVQELDEHRHEEIGPGQPPTVLGSADNHSHDSRGVLVSTRRHTSNP